MPRVYIEVSAGTASRGREAGEGCRDDGAAAFGQSQNTKTNACSSERAGRTCMVVPGGHSIRPLSVATIATSLVHFEAAAGAGAWAVPQARRTDDRTAMTVRLLMISS